MLSIKININLYNDYIQSSGKTRALFGLFEFKYMYRYYLGTFTLIEFFLSVYFLRKKENMVIAFIATIISIIAGILLFFSVWRLFI